MGLGSNLAHPACQIKQALKELAQLPGCHLLAHSRFYRSPPWGPIAQPDYVNAVAVLVSRLAPSQLLRRLLALEARHGRIRSVRWGARTLDLDLLVWGAKRLRQPSLRLPHPALRRRSFVLYPLAELAPRLNIPGYGRLPNLLAQCGRHGLRFRADC